MDRKVGSSASKLKRVHVKQKPKPYMKQSPRKTEYLTGKKREQNVKNNKFQQNDDGFKSVPDSAGANVAKTLEAEINHILESAKEEAINIIEIAKRKAQESIRKVASQGWLVNPGHEKQPDISSGVNKITISNTLSSFCDRPVIASLSSITEEESDGPEYELTDIHSVQVNDSKEAIIMDNLDRYESYIAECVKTTDLIVYFGLFKTAQTKELRSIYKTNPFEATKRAVEMIRKMTNQPERYSCLVSALSDAGYPKVVDILEGTLIPVGSRHREIIRHCTKHLFHRLNTTEILPYLYSKGIISADDKQHIQRTERNDSTGIAALELLDLLPNRNKRWFSYFIEALVESGHEDLAKIIKENTNEIIITETPRKNKLGDSFGGLKQTIDRSRDTMPPMIPLQKIVQRKAKPKLLFHSDVRNTNRNKDDIIDLMHERQNESETVNTDTCKRPAVSDRISSPIFVSCDDYSCVQASRMDHGLDFSDSSFPLDEQ